MLRKSEIDFSSLAREDESFDLNFNYVESHFVVKVCISCCYQSMRTSEGVSELER